MAKELSNHLFEEGVYIPAFGYPIVPKGQARLRAQPSAAHSRADIEQALHVFEKAGHLMNVI